MLDMSNYTFALYFWSVLAAAGLTLPFAIAAVSDLARRGRRDAPSF